MARAKEILLNVLELYKDMPFLWDKTHKDYANKYRRNEGYIALLDIFKEYDQDANIKVLVKKIQNLRTGYIKEVKKVKAAEKAGKRYVPTLWYFHLFSFLDDNIESCDSVKDPLEKEDLPSSSDAESNYEIKWENESASPPHKQIKFTKTAAYKKRKRIRGSPRQSIEESSPMRKEEYEILGKAIGLQLRDLGKRQLTIAQKLISDTIYYAKTGLLTEESFVVVDKSGERSRHDTSPSTLTFHQHSFSSSPK